MCRRGETRIIRFIILALFFVILAGGIYVTVGKEFKSALSLKMRMAIEQGIPVGDYSQKDSTPQEGELKRSKRIFRTWAVVMGGSSVRKSVFPPRCIMEIPMLF